MGGAAMMGQPQPLAAGQGNKLFVGNLPADVNAEMINAVFGTYGTVTNMHIMSGRSKSGQACAFVTYASPLEAETAILTLHEKYEVREGEGHLLVRYANPPQAQRASPY